jgi:hypothetical protein
LEVVKIVKNQQYFAGMILFGFGGYFLLQHTNIAFFQQFSGWPTLMMIIGVAMLWQGYKGREYELIFPGVIVFGFGLHFHVVTNFHLWPDEIGVFLLIVALAFILKYQKTGSGLAQGLLFAAISGMLLFQNRILAWFGTLESQTSLLFEYWPIVLIGFGAYMLFKKKR